LLLTHCRLGTLMRKFLILMFTGLLNFFPAYSSADVYKIPKEIPATDLKRTDGAHPAFMKQFAEWAFQFFDREPQMREAARKMAEKYYKDKNQQPQGMDWVIELYKIGGYEIKQDDNLMETEEKLNHDERYAVDKTFKGIAFYLVQLPGEEAINAGIVPEPRQQTSDTPEMIKKYILGILAPYKSGKVKSSDEVKKEIKSVWDGMRNALLAGNIDGAIEYFSTSSKDSYRNKFQELKERGLLSKMASDIDNMAVVKVDIYHAEGDLRVNEDGKEFSYYVIFQPEGDGQWKIISF
jgi:hypothetical protein